jgi:pimeloyl-ACP methyl ester carboxylesterase
VSSRNFVLVHGGWHGGWCWRRVADRLRQRGHVVFTPTLTGLGDRSHLLDNNVGLDTHVRDIVNLLQWEDLDDVVLVGHSYAGCVISAVAEHSAAAIGSIVFLDAFLPENGEALVDMASQLMRDAIDTVRNRGETRMAPVLSAYFKLNETDRAWVDAKCTPQPIRTFTDKVTLSGARERIARKVYIRATGYPSAPYDAALARTRADPSWNTLEIPCGHDAMIDMPERLVEILLTDELIGQSAISS